MSGSRLQTTYEPNYLCEDLGGFSRGRPCTGRAHGLPCDKELSWGVVEVVGLGRAGGAALPGLVHEVGLVRRRPGVALTRSLPPAPGPVVGLSVKTVMDPPVGPPRVEAPRRKNDSF